MSNIPYDAQIVYLESTGTQYIDTGFKPNQDTRIVATMQCVTSTSYGRLFGSGTYNTLNSVMADYETNITGTLHIKYGNNSSWTNISSIHGDYEIHTYDFNKNNFYIDGGLVSSNTYSTFQSTSNLGIFTYINGNNVNQNTEFFIGRLYSFQIYDNDILVRDYIPVRVNETGYLYDKVSGELFSNAGTGNFILGNDFLNGFVSSFRRRLLNTYRAPLPNYLCFTALEDGTFTLTIGAMVDINTLGKVAYSIDEGNTWVETANVNNQEIIITTPTITTGSKVLWRGSGPKFSRGYQAVSYRSVFSSSGTFNISGNIMSLLYWKDFDNEFTISSSYTFYYSFSNCVGIIDASEMLLPATTLQNGYEYRSLFDGCTNLKYAPKVLPAKTLKAQAYSNMFNKCSSLLTVPNISAVESLSNSSMSGMFAYCTSLEEVPLLNATILGITCYATMFRYDTKIKTAPVLPVSVVPQNGYQYMFHGCSQLNYIKMLATDISATGCLTNWLASVPNVSTSIFVKHINATWTTTGASGVPTNWTIIYYDPAVDKYYTDQTKATECDDHGNPL